MAQQNRLTSAELMLVSSTATVSSLSFAILHNAVMSLAAVGSRGSIGDHQNIEELLV